MEFFQGFPKVSFNNRKITNICARIDFFNNIKQNNVLFEFIQVSDGERPEDIAQLVYQDSNLYWIILMVNDIVDPYTEWVMTSDQLYQYVAEKYGEENIYSPNHYETTSQSDLGEGVWVNFGTPFSTMVSNYEHENSLNEKKRLIRILKPLYIGQVLEEYQNALRQ